MQINFFRRIYEKKILTQPYENKNIISLKVNTICKDMNDFVLLNIFRQDFRVTNIKAIELLQPDLNDDEIVKLFQWCDQNAVEKVLLGECGTWDVMQPLLEVMKTNPFEILNQCKSTFSDVYTRKKY